MKKFIDLRVANNLSCKDLGEILGISQGSISNYERGITKPTSDVILAYCKYFSVSSDFLLGLNLESPKEICNIASYQGGQEDLSKVISDLEETIKVLRELQKKL
jgi:transcriptional regulator with XRE-family HTH domain